MENLKIYIWANKPIENEIPKGKEYVIIAQNDTIKDKEHEVIYLTNDTFTKNHSVCYSEGCAIRYLWKHPEILPDYIGIAHYDRFFIDFIGKEDRIPKIVDSKGAIVAYPFIHKDTIRHDNWTIQIVDHFEKDATVLRQVVNDLYPDFAEVYEKMLSNDKQYGCNMFVMKKADFLRMCEICFTILDEFDKRRNYKTNFSVERKIQLEHGKERIVGGLEWQCRLQGFYLEWLTDTFYRYAFDVHRCYKGHLGLPNSQL